MTRKSRSSIEERGAKELVQNLLEANASYAEIIHEVEQATGQRLSNSALSRYREQWSDAKARLGEAEQQAKVVLEVLQAHPGADFKSAALGLLWTKLLKRMAEAEASFDSADMLELGHLLLKAVRADQTGDALGLQRDRLELLTKKVAATADKVEQVAKAKGLDEETLKMIREEIYGLAPA